MKLALVIASLIAVGFASSGAYVLKQGLAPEEYNVVLIPVQEEILQEDGSVEVPSLNEEDNYSEARGILMEEPRSRVRRQATVDITRNTHTGGTSVSAQAQGTLWSRGPHSVDGNAHWSRVFGGRTGTSHPSYGGGLTYTRSNRASVGVDVSRQRPFGTQVSAQAQGTLWRSNNGRSTIDANAAWSRSYGGAWGTSRPNYGGMINFKHRF